MLARLKRQIWARHITPFLGRRGWRPSRATPLDEYFLPSRFGFDDEQQIKQHARIVREHSMASLERLATLWQQVRYLDRYAIPGTLVECGVWRGGTAAMMALAHMQGNAKPWREIHLFDSFEGLPEPDGSKDGREAERMAPGRSEGRLIPIGYCVADQQDCVKLLDAIGYPRELVHVHPGWFEHVIPPLAGGMPDIALLRLDGDWYHSTKLCLDQLYDQVVANGVVVIDDYGHFSGCKQAVDEFLAARGEPVLLNHIDYTARSWVKVRSD